MPIFRFQGVRISTQCASRRSPSRWQPALPWASLPSVCPSPVDDAPFQTNVRELHSADLEIRLFEGPIATIENDSLPTRQNLVDEANRIATNEGWVSWKPQTEVVSIQSANGQFQLELSDGSTIACDHVMANTGFLGDFEMHHGLHVHRCYVSGGPMAWAASIIALNTPSAR